MRQAVGQGAAHDDNPGLMQVDSQEAEGGNRGPADDIADHHSQEAENDLEARLFLEGGQIGLLRHGGTNKSGGRDFFDTLSDHLACLAGERGNVLPGLIFAKVINY